MSFKTPPTHWAFKRYRQGISVSADILHVLAQQPDKTREERAQLRRQRDAICAAARSRRGMFDGR